MGEGKRSVGLEKVRLWEGMGDKASDIYNPFAMEDLLNIKFLKQPTNPLRLIKTTNVYVSGLTESLGARFGRH